MTIRVQSGANSQEINPTETDVVRIAEIRDRLGIVLNLEETAIAVVDDAEVNDDFVVKDGQTVQFIKRSGSKG
jgi:hypothetical protein